MTRITISAAAKRGFAWRRDGISYNRIAKRLNAEGIRGKQGGAFHASTIHAIVGNDLHAPAGA